MGGKGSELGVIAQLTAGHQGSLRHSHGSKFTVEDDSLMRLIEEA